MNKLNNIMQNNINISLKNIYLLFYDNQVTKNNKNILYLVKIEQISISIKRLKNYDYKYVFDI